MREAEEAERERLRRSCPCGLADPEDTPDGPDWFDWTYVLPPGKAKMMFLDEGRNRFCPLLLRRERRASCGRSWVILGRGGSIRVGDPR